MPVSGRKTRAFCAASAGLQNAHHYPNRSVRRRARKPAFCTPAGARRPSADQARRAVDGALAPSIADGGAIWIQTNQADQKKSTRTTSAPSKPRRAICWRAATTSPAPHDVAPAKTTKHDNGIQSKTAAAVFLRPRPINTPRKKCNTYYTRNYLCVKQPFCAQFHAHARARVSRTAVKNFAVQL